MTYCESDLIYNKETTVIINIGKGLKFGGYAGLGGSPVVL